MPYINVKLIPDERLDAAKKDELIARLTAAVSATLGKDPAMTWVTIDEVAPENWGVGGQSVAARRHAIDDKPG